MILKFCFELNTPERLLNMMKKKLRIALKIKSPEWNTQIDTQTDTEFYQY